MMRASEAMIVWTPNRDKWKEYSTAGTIEVTTIPQPAALKRHPMSIGACDLNWRDTDDEGRMNLMQRYFTQLIHRDKIDEQTVLSALSYIDEFRDHRFDNSPPNDEEDAY